MKSKIFTSIAILASMLVIYTAGLSAGQKQTRQECIDTVSENCEYICGVGADFYYPEKEDREFNNIGDPDQLKFKVAQKEIRKF